MLNLKGRRSTAFFSFHFSTFQDVDVDINTKKGDWKAKHDSILDAIKEAKKTRPPSAKKDIEVQIVVK